MKPFMDENFLLQNQTALKIYHEYAKDMPIYDYHCHLNPKEIAQNKRYRNITELWLGGDHYKWRAIRSNGIDEKYITGEADDKEKFMKWAKTMQYCIGNPLYHWTHLELKRYFGIDEILSSKTAESIWEKCNDMLQSDDFTARGLILRSNVRVICTTDDPLDSLEYHKAIVKDTGFGVKVLPAFRPDKSFNIDKEGFADWISSLGSIVGYRIECFDDLKNALSSRLEYFHKLGCRISDHALDPIVYREGSEEEASVVLGKALMGQALSIDEIEKYKTHVMIFLGRKYARLGWTMQLHLGTMRNNNSRMMRLLGPDTGFDAIGDWNFAKPLSRFLDRLDETDELPKTILYSLNPRDNEVLGTIIGCFQGGGIPGKIQFGSAWWFNDQKDGMERQLTALANLGLLGRFVGMLTDSRSFLSYTRHEYFRRILCNLIGTWVENGEAPNDMDIIGGIIKDICFYNAKEYFGIDI
ncbi:MAG: glucuronate isomerase [Bacillota bacterium]